MNLGRFSSMGQGDTSQLELTRTKRELTRIDIENKRLNNLCESLKKELDGAEYNVRDLEADLAVSDRKQNISTLIGSPLILFPILCLRLKVTI